MVAELRRRGLASFLVTGDHEGAAGAAAAALEIPPQRVHAGALPAQKAALVEAIREGSGPVAVVGDGLNDAPAMARADVSVSLGGATDVARETADVVLLNDDLRDLLLALEIARHAMGIVEQNRSLVVVPNVAAIAYGALAVLSPVAGAVINNGAALVAALNSLRPLEGPGAAASPHRGAAMSATARRALPAPSGTPRPAVGFRIGHRIGGRVRITIPRLGRDRAYAERLVGHLAATGLGLEVRVNPGARTLVLAYDRRQHQEAEILAGVAGAIQAAADLDLAPLPSAEAPEAAGRISYGKRLGLPAVAMALAVGTLGGLAAPPLVVGGALLAAAVPSFKRAWAGIRDERKLNVDFLDSMAISLLTTSGFFFPPALMIGLIELGEIIRDLTARRTARANLDLLDLLGRVARVEREGVEQEVPLGEVGVGDVVVVYPGDQIPVDGTVLSGRVLVDQQRLTGELIPVLREEGEDVLAATLLVDGTLRIETRRTGENTRAGVVVALMQSAPVHDTRMEDYARKVGDRIVVPTLALGGGVTLATGGNMVAGVSVITLDIGTGIRVSVPTAILAALTFAARDGILIRSGRALEQLARVDSAVFDKTGTLTRGRAGVVAIYGARDGISPDAVLQLAASAEQGLTHPVAEAITRHARERERRLAGLRDVGVQGGPGGLRDHRRAPHRRGQPALHARGGRGPRSPHHGAPRDRGQRGLAGVRGRGRPAAGGHSLPRPGAPGERRSDRRAERAGDQRPTCSAGTCALWPAPWRRSWASPRSTSSPRPSRSARWRWCGSCRSRARPSPSSGTGSTTRRPWPTPASRSPSPGRPTWPARPQTWC